MRNDLYSPQYPCSSITYFEVLATDANWRSSSEATEKHDVLKIDKIRKAEDTKVVFRWTRPLVGEKDSTWSEDEE